MSDNSSHGADQQQFIAVVDGQGGSPVKTTGAKGEEGKAQDAATQHAHGLESKQLVAAAMEVAQVLGPSVRPFIAQIGRVYEGPIVHVKDGLAFQHTAPDSAVVHKVGDLAGDSQRLKSLSDAVQHQRPVSIGYDEKGAPELENIRRQRTKEELSHAKEVGGDER